MMRVESVLFDLDGTLIDSAPDLCAAGNELRRRRGIPELPFSGLRGWAGKGARGLVWASMRVSSESGHYPPLQQELLAWYGKHLHDHLVLMEGAEELLAGLDAAGIPWGIVTNKYVELAEPSCRALGLLPRSRCLVGGDTAGKRKPAPDSILHALRITGFDPASTVYVGDDLRDMQAAQAAGIAGWAAGWGYLQAHESCADWNPDAAFSTPAGLLSAVLASRR